MLPTTPARATHDYQRKGTCDLFAALNAATGTVISDIRKSHTSPRRPPREHKLGRMCQTEEIAPAAVFLLSSEDSFVTGHALVVDGAYTAGRDHGMTAVLGLSGP
jgi:NAD(P)-dependent dehydrogenase (short-subunit alcohol dehydrogenase family)